MFRIFDEEKAKAFYLNFLGMILDWEHRFEANYPTYMQVSKQNLVLHLSKHFGDYSPGAKTFRLTGKRADLLAEAAVENTKRLSTKVKAISFDNGVEFAEHEKIGAGLEADIYFAHPYAS